MHVTRQIGVVELLPVEMISAGARRFKDRIAVSTDDAQMSYAQVDEISRRLANVLIGLGVKPLERIGILVGNELLTIPFDFAALKARCVRVPLNARLSLREHASMISSAEVRRVVYSPSLAGRAEELESTLDGVQFLSLGANGLGHLDILTASQSASPAASKRGHLASDPVLALFTSGTTGTLKAALHSEATYGAIVTNILANLVSPAPDDVMIHAAPLIHASGTFVFPFWLRGARAHVMNGFEPGAYLASCAVQGVTHASLVPTMVQMLMNSTDPTQYDLNLRSIIYGASPMPTSTIGAALETFGPIFTQYYGQTEAPLAISVLSAADHNPQRGLLQSAGSPSVDATVKILGPDGHEMAPGEIGEITVEAPFVMEGYLDAPDLDATTFLEPRRIKTRDLGYIDESGYLFLVERSSDMIISGGYNVYPREVEDVLLSHPDVAECGVVGKEDPTWVEIVVAFVALKPGATTSVVELSDFARQRLAGYKVPKEIHLIDAMPKSVVGKVLRRALRERLEQ
jgi:fatty-acyl-CoA synthase